MYFFFPFLAKFQKFTELKIEFWHFIQKSQRQYFFGLQGNSFIKLILYPTQEIKLNKNSTFKVPSNFL